MSFTVSNRPADVYRRKKNKKRGTAASSALRSPLECETHRVMLQNAVFLLDLAAAEDPAARGASSGGSQRNSLLLGAGAGPFPAVAFQCLHTLGSQQAHLRRLKEDELSAELRRQSDAEQLPPPRRHRRRSAARPVSACVSTYRASCWAPRVHLGMLQTRNYDEWYWYSKSNTGMVW